MTRDRFAALLTGGAVLAGILAAGPAHAAAAASAKAPSVLVLVDASHSAAGEDPGARLRRQWLRLLAGAMAPGQRFGVAVFAGPKSQRWLVHPGEGASSRAVAAGARLSQLPGPTDAPAAARWALLQVRTLGLARRGPVRVVVMADDEPDPGEHRFPAAYRKALAAVTHAYAAAKVDLVTLRIGDNPGPIAWPVVPTAGPATAAPRVLRWLGLEEVAGAVGRVLPLPASFGLRTLSVPRPGSPAWHPGARPAQGASLWRVAGAPPTIAYRFTQRSVQMALYGPGPIAVALPGPHGRERHLSLGGGRVQTVPTVAADRRVSTWRIEGATLAAVGGAAGAPQIAPPPRAGTRGRSGTPLLPMAILVLLLVLAAAAGAMTVRRRLTPTRKERDARRAARAARRRTGRVVLVAERLLADGEGVGLRRRLPRGVRSLVLGAAKAPGVQLALPTGEAGALLRLERTQAGWRLHSLGDVHMYGEDGLPRRELELVTGQWVRAADVRLVLVPYAEEEAAAHAASQREVRV